MPHEHPRDRSIEHMLRRGVAAAAPPSTPGACVDGETLAAWSAGALSPQAAARVEEHLADCARCQAMLAAFAQTGPDTPVRAPWWQSAHLRWLVPLATAATVAAIWVATPHRGGLPQSAPAAQTAPQASTGAQRPAGETARRDTSTPAEPGAPSGQAPRLEARGAPELKRESSPRASISPRADAAGGAASQAETAARDREADQRAMTTIPSLTVSADAPIVNPAAPAPPAPTAEKPAESIAAFSSAPSEIVSPDGTSRWRIVNGEVQRWSPQDGTWQPAALPSKNLAAGHAPSASVAWFVGKAGAIFVTDDGTSFERISFVSSADLIAVVAIDDRQATVTTADGQQFRTPDRGASWTAF